MATGDYKLTKTNSGGPFDEKTVTAENGKALAFNSDLDPVMVSYQPLNAILTSISGLGVGVGLIKYSTPSTITLDSSQYVKQVGLGDTLAPSNVDYTDAPIVYTINSQNSLDFKRGTGIKMRKVTGTGVLTGYQAVEFSVVPSEIDMITQKTSVVIDKDYWTTGTNFFEYVIEDEDILEGSYIEIIPVNTDYLTVANAQILPEVLISEGQVTIYAIAVPTADITVSYNITQ